MTEEINGKNLENNFIEINCPNCDSNDYSNFRRISDIVKCNNCGLVYLHKRMDEQTHTKIFSETSFDDEIFDNPEDLEKLIYSRKNFFDEIISVTDKIETLIDIGSGWGSLLKLASDYGINSVGYEINQNMIGFCIEKFGLNVKENFLNDPDLKDNSTDVISSLYSLPYFANINQYIKKIFNTLKRGGIFCGIVPNIESFASETLEDEWEYLTPYKNLIYFSPDTLTNFLEKNGFIFEKLYTTTGNYDKHTLDLLVKDAFNIDLPQEIDEQITVLNNEGMGEEIWFFARKPITDTLTVSQSEKPEEIENNVVQLSEEETFSEELITETNSQENEELELKTEVSEEEREFLTSQTPKQDEEEIIIEFNDGDDLDLILHQTFLSMKEYKKIKILDKSNSLPDFVKNWNNVEVINTQIPENLIDEIIPEQESEIQEEIPEEFTLEPQTPQEIQEEFSEELNITETPSLELNVSEKQEISPNDLSVQTQANELEPEGKFTEDFAKQDNIKNLPSDLPKPLRLNLGCGNDIREGFVNIDFHSNDERVIKMDVRKLEFSDESVDMILASDILEHFSHREVDNVLKEWARVLKLGGNIIIRCPSLKLQAQAYLKGDWDADVASYMIFGAQTNPGDYHCIAFDEHSIKKHLSLAGFQVIEFYEKNIPQDKGYINLNMLIRAKKVTSLISRKQEPQPINEDTSEFADLDFGKEELNEITETNNTETSEIPEKLNIVWEGPQFKYNSLALVNREITYNLIRTKIANITVIPFGEDEFSPEGNDKFELIKFNDIRFKPEDDEKISKLPYVWIRHQWPPQDKEPKGAKWIIMQPWEFSRLTKKLANLFNQANEIWTPSNYSRDAIVNSGIDFDKVQIIPNGINPDILKPFGEKYPLKTNKKIKFLFVGGTIYRKGIDILLKAYTNTFTKDDNVCLVIKDLGSDTFYKGINAKEKINEIIKNTNNPEIEYIDDVITEEEIAALYRACDVLVSPYRGEGFSLPTLEAMACGLPVVVTDGGSTDDFCTNEFSWKIPSKEVNFGTELNDDEFVESATLLEPDISELMDILKDIYENPNEIFTRGFLASRTARTKWTWEKSTLKVISRLDFLYDLNMYAKAKNILINNEDIDLSFTNAIKNMIDKDYEQAKIKYNEIINNKDANEEITYYSKLTLAYINLIQKDYDNCENLINQILEKYPETVDIKYIKAKMYFLKKQWIEGLEAVTEIYDNWQNWKYDTKIGLGLDDILCDTAEALLELDDPDNALKLYSHALKQNPNSSKACLGSAKCFLWADAKEEAKEMLEWAIKLDETNEEAKNLLKDLIDN